MAWASLHFSIRLISCCKKWNRAHNTPYVWISSIHSHTVKFLLLQACAFLCNFLRLHKHEACWLWDNENVSRFPPTEEKAKADTSLLNSSPSREFSSTCWDANCGCVFCFFFANNYSDRELADVFGGWHGGGKYRVAEIEAISASHKLVFLFFLQQMWLYYQCLFTLVSIIKLLFQKRFAAASKQSMFSFPSFADWEDEAGGEQQKCAVQTISRGNQWG